MKESKYELEVNDELANVAIDRQLIAEALHIFGDDDQPIRDAFNNFGSDEYEKLLESLPKVTRGAKTIAEFVKLAGDRWDESVGPILKGWFIEDLVTYLEGAVEIAKELDDVETQERIRRETTKDGDDLAAVV